MGYKEIISEIAGAAKFQVSGISEPYDDEVHIDLLLKDFKAMCLGLHRRLRSPVMMLFAADERSSRGVFVISCVFMSAEHKKWFFVSSDVDRHNPEFESMSREIYSANFFERDIKEMFGMDPIGHPDPRRLNLHDEVWPKGAYPLRKDFKRPENISGGSSEYVFKKIEGEGVFEVPVGPVHAGIIGPGHFRFSVAGEPIINLELRLGFTHRGVEKLFENKAATEGVALSECVSGDSAFGHSLAFCRAVEKICGIAVPKRAEYLRAIFLELERMYNHAADMGGIAVDVGFSFPAAYASVIKESILVLNEVLTGHRYLKGANKVGGVNAGLAAHSILELNQSLETIENDFKELKNILLSSVSFLDRVDSTGILKKKTAEDLGVVGLAARASGIPIDLRKGFPGVYNELKFNSVKENGGDVLARLNVRIAEFEESISIIRQCVNALASAGPDISVLISPKEGCALGYSEGWRGGILYWIKMNSAGAIERCKIVDPSFHNWQALSFAVLGNIVPDFPVCNKSFDLSYSGNDL